MRKLEALFAVLIATMAISFAWMFGETKPDGGELMIGENEKNLLTQLEVNECASSS